MNWVILIVSVAILSGRSLSTYPQYGQEQKRGYQGPDVVPVLLPGGFIADTEEVARAKDLHFNAYARAASSVKDNRYNTADEYQQPQYTQVHQQPQYTQGHQQPQYTQGHQQPQYTQVHQQPQYTQVRQQAYSPQQYQPQRQQDYNVPQHQYTGVTSRSYAEPKASVNYQPQQRYQGPSAVPVILPNGYLAETADVEAAKEHHFQLVAQAQAAVARAQERANTKNYGYTAAYSPKDDYEEPEPEQQYNQVYQPAQTYSKPSRQRYQGPPVVPVVLPSGHIADTAEVAAAKISHLQQLLDAAQKSQPQPHYRTSR